MVGGGTLEGHQVPTTKFCPQVTNAICGSYDSKLVWFDMDLSTKPYRVLR